LGAADFAKDAAQLKNARDRYAEGRKLVEGGKAKDAKAAFRRALDAALIVGNLAGKRAAALEVAADARRAVRVCDAILALEDRRAAARRGDWLDASGVDAIDEAASKGAFAKEPLEKLTRKDLVREQELTAEALERVAVDSDARTG